LQGQEEAACARSANVTTSVLFTATNTVKFPSAVTQSSWALPLSYYRASTFLPCRISKLKMSELGATVVKNQPFHLLWRPFPYLRLKLDRLECNSNVTRELIPLFLCRMSKLTFITIHSTTFVTQPSILHLLTKKNFDRSFFYYFFIFATFAHLSIFLRNEVDNL